MLRWISIIGGLLIMDVAPRPLRRAVSVHRFEDTVLGLLPVSFNSVARQIYNFKLILTTPREFASFSRRLT